MSKQMRWLVNNPYREANFMMAELKAEKTKLPDECSFTRAR